MTETRVQKSPPQRGALNDAIWDVALGVAVFAAGLMLTRLFKPARLVEHGSPENLERYSRELRIYVIGFGLALALTVGPFALVYWSVLSPFWLFIAIGAFALVQVVVHFRCFLHIDPPKQKNDDLQLILFSSLILLLMVGGTIWILANLAIRMH
ncbi:MAG: cytochrome C oxidase subunit IV family protein [Xanthobacteraceae bacterium]